MTTVGFRLTGRYPPGDPPPYGERSGFHRRCANYFEALDVLHKPTCTFDEDLEGRPCLFVEIHPAAEPLFISDLGDGAFLAWAHTSSVGPGYHIHLSELFHDLTGELGLEIDPPGTGSDHGRTGDSTSYFFTRDRAAVERAMLDCLATVCRGILQSPALEPGERFALSLRSGTDFETDQFLMTTMGPRSREWAVAAAAYPAGAVNAFPWFEAGQGAAYHLGRAVSRMWCDVRWVRPLLPPEYEVNADVLASLEVAYRADPTLNYPWREWHELLGYALGEKPPLAADVAQFAAQVPADRPLIGYRRGYVVKHVSDRTVRVPGSFHEFPIDPEGMWATFDRAGRMINVTTTPLDPRFGTGPESVLHFLRTRDTPRGEFIERFEHGRGAAKGIAALVRRPAIPPLEGMRYHLQGLIVVPGWVTCCFVTFVDLADRQWALDIWHSVDVPDEFSL